MRLEGNNGGNSQGSLWQTLLNLQVLWVHFEEAKLSDHSEYMDAAIALGFEKLNTYFTLLVHTPDVSYYTIATALNPALRLNWFQTQWKHYPEWVSKAQKSVKKVFDDYVKAEAATDDNDELREPPSRRKVPANDLYSRVTAVDTHLLTGNKNKRQRRIGQIEEYYESLDTDLNAANERDQPVLQDPWGWWQRVGRNRYPILFKIACDYLTIPCTSCDCERCFSSARRTITDDRNGLSGTTIEALQLQKNWLRRGVVKSSILDLSKYVTSLTKISDFGSVDSTENCYFSSTDSQSVTTSQS